MGTKLKTTLFCLLSLFAVAALLLFYQFAQNGRYQFKDGSSTIVIDTRTGATYRADKYSGDLQPVSRGAGVGRP